MEGPLELASCLFESEEIIVIPIGIIISAIPIVLLFGTVLVTVLHRRDKRRREQQGNGNRPRQRVFLCWTIILGAGDALVIGFAVFVSCLFELNRYMIALYILAGLLLALLLIALMAQNLGKRAFLPCWAAPFWPLARSAAENSICTICGASPYRRALTSAAIPLLWRAAPWPGWTRRLRCASTTWIPRRGWTAPRPSIPSMPPLPRRLTRRAWRSWRAGRFKRSSPAAPQAVLTGRS